MTISALSDQSDTVEQWDQWLHFLKGAKKAKYIAVDTEGDGKDVRDPHSGAVTMGVSIAYRTPNGGLASEYFAFYHKIGKNQPEYFDAVKDVIQNAKNIIMHNVRHDFFALEILGMPIDFSKTRVYCTMSMCHFINENRLSYALDALCRTIINKSKAKSDMMKKIIDLFGWGSVPVNEMRPYSAQDTAITLELFEAIYPEFCAQGFDGQLWDDEIEFLLTLNNMEEIGIEIDQELCTREKAIGEKRMEEIVSLLGGRRPSSKNDLSDLLHRELGLPVLARTDKGVLSFNKEAMKKYDFYLQRMNSPVARLVTEFRGWQKVVGTNYSAYLRFVGSDGRLRPHYMTHRALTTRLTSGSDSDGKSDVNSPNLQNIPRVSDKRWDGQLKKAFIPATGYRLWESDFSNAELRLTAAYSKDPGLLAIFKEGRKIFDEMSKTLRRPKVIIKGFVYATSYGAKDDRVGQILGITPEEAKSLRSDFVSAYPRIFAFKSWLAGRAQRRLYIQFWSGRRRHFNNRGEAKHLSFNSLMQGGIAEIVKNRMIALNNIIDWDECRMLLQVHDSLVFEIKIGCEAKWHAIIKRVMEDVPAALSDKVPFPVEIKEWAA